MPPASARRRGRRFRCIGAVSPTSGTGPSRGSRAQMVRETDMLNPSSFQGGPSTPVGTITTARFTCLASGKTLLEPTCPPSRGPRGGRPEYTGRYLRWVGWAIHFVEGRIGKKTEKQLGCCGDPVVRLPALLLRCFRNHLCLCPASAKDGKDPLRLAAKSEVGSGTPAGPVGPSCSCGRQRLAQDRPVRLLVHGVVAQRRGDVTVPQMLRDLDDRRRGLRQD
jgi:hypothetical protein